jgi:DNA helicase-2/ATP-dependent DNA helicase PcrA
VLTRTNAQLAVVQAAMEAEHVPCLVAGSDLGPASDLRTGRRSAEADEDGDDEVTVDRDCVVLSTFHRAKGLQWPTVLVVGLSAGLMPLASAQTPDAIDEERRLLYVALTRAEEELWCSWSEAESAERTNRRQPSPWLAPIERTIAKLAQEAAPTAAAEVSARVAELRQRLESSGGPNR